MSEGQRCALREAALTPAYKKTDSLAPSVFLYDRTILEGF